MDHYVQKLSSSQMFCEYITCVTEVVWDERHFFHIPGG
jgi:hypothetical protein